MEIPFFWQFYCAKAFKNEQVHESFVAVIILKHLDWIKKLPKIGIYGQIDPQESQKGKRPVFTLLGPPGAERWKTSSISI